MDAGRVWSLGDYATPGDRWSSAGEALAAETVRGGHRVLDVACGPGAMAVRAAGLGATVTGLDAAPALLDRAREHAGAAAVSVCWIEADMTATGESDASYDCVLSAFGAMFAADPAAMAAELVRVCAPGGVVGNLAWTPGSPFGRMRPLAASYLPPEAHGPDVGAWGRPESAAGFFARLPVSVTSAVQTIEVTWPSLDAAVAELTEKTPPWIIIRSMVEPHGRWPELVSRLSTMLGEAGDSRSGRFVLPVSYLKLTARKYRA